MYKRHPEPSSHYNTFAVDIGFEPMDQEMVIFLAKRPVKPLQQSTKKYEVGTGFEPVNPIKDCYFSRVVPSTTRSPYQQLFF